MTFTFRGPLLRLVGYQRSVEVQGATVRESLDALCASFPPLRGVLFDGRGGLRPVHRLALNNCIITRAELEAPVAAADRIDVLTAVAGG